MGVETEDPLQEVLQYFTTLHHDGHHTLTWPSSLVHADQRCRSISKCEVPCLVAWTDWTIASNTARTPENSLQGPDRPTSPGLVLTAPPLQGPDRLTSPQSWPPHLSRVLTASPLPESWPPHLSRVLTAPPLQGPDRPTSLGPWPPHLSRVVTASPPPESWPPHLSRVLTAPPPQNTGRPTSPGS
ncbi:cleavage and polyadenylation specificity factor subunit 6-like [Hyalella azteca]|uniref:Cleavage and polyadenylation specificity factor subunit 6-like n=1 Tax=Hyalella azteca TaxID=294128 RepID=A0A8B7PG06_HYAAZ|nr:cleavage and polyadenylation specificity factor subunit 6-like [Hyalella azteca]